jgi:hypothetical protein
MAGFKLGRRRGGHRGGVMGEGNASGVWWWHWRRRRFAAGPVVGDAAWAKKAKIKCKVNGEGFKTNVIAGGAGGVYTPETQMLILGGARAKIPRTQTRRRSKRTFASSSSGVLSVPDLSTAQLPLSLPVDEDAVQHPPDARE